MDNIYKPNEKWLFYIKTHNFEDKWTKLLEAQKHE